MEFTPEELDLLRQWYDAVQDSAPEYLEQRDHMLAIKILTALGPDWATAAQKAKKAAQK
jgi:hypothetical protein